MVHALELLHRLLKAGGYLLDIHPSGEPPPVYVCTRDREELAGWLQESDDFIEYSQADAALTAIIARGLFKLDRQASFIFNTYTANITEMKEYLEATWSDVLISPELVARTEQLQDEMVGRINVVFRERVRIARYNKLEKFENP